MITAINRYHSIEYDIVRAWRAKPVSVVGRGASWHSAAIMRGERLFVFTSESGFVKLNMGYLTIVLLVLLLAFMTPRPTVLTGVDYGQDVIFKGKEYKVTDNRGLFYRSSGLLRVLEGFIRKPSESIRLAGPMKFCIMGGVGYSGFISGPRTHVLDVNALPDPLLARMRTGNIDRVWIGHFYRDIPTGYYRTLKSGNNVIVNRNIAEFYDKIRLITRGEIFDRQRLVTIWNMNIGKYDYLIKNEIVPTLIKKRPDLRQLRYKIGNKEFNKHEPSKTAEKNID